MSIKIIIADDHPLMRDGIKAIISSDEGLEIIGEASDGEQACKQIAQKKPDIAILDISMPKKSGLEVLRDCHNKDVKYIILSNYDEDEYIIEAVRLGAKAYVLKDIEASNIVEIIYRVSEGKIYYSQQIMNVLVNQLAGVSNQHDITEKEKEIIRLISDGSSSKMIAAELDISTRTVESHRYNIMKKLDVNNSAELIKKATKLKLI